MLSDEFLKRYGGDASHNDVTQKMRKRLFEILEETNGLTMNLMPDRGKWFPWRHRERAGQGKFPSSFFDPLPD